MITFDTSPQGSPEWFAARRGVCTASRFRDARDRSDGLTDQQRTYVEAILAGKPEGAAQSLAGYKAKPTSSAVASAIAGTLQKTWGAKAMSYARDLARERLGGESPPTFIRPEYAAAGHEGEKAARVATEAAFGLLIEEAGLAITEDRKFGGSVDGLIGDDGIWECKTMVSSSVMFQAVVEGDIQEYVDQCQGNLWLLGRKWAKLTLYCPDMPRKLHPPILIERNEAYIEDLETDLMAFERLVCEQQAALAAKQAVML